MIPSLSLKACSPTLPIMWWCWPVVHLEELTAPVRFSTQLLNKFEVKLPNVILSHTLPYIAHTISSQIVARLFEYAAFPHFPTYVCIGSLSVLVLPKQMLKVSWKPSDDAGRSLIDYIVTTTAGMDYNYPLSILSPRYPSVDSPSTALAQCQCGQRTLVH